MLGEGLGKAGMGAPLSSSESNLERRERLRRLAMETVDLAKDPYFMKNHLGTYECKLCLTLHNTEGNYLSHTQGRRHQMNLARRAAKEKSEAGTIPQANRPAPKKSVKIGRPGYQVMKQRDTATGQRSLHFSIHYPEVDDGITPRHRVMAAAEQSKEAGTDFQLLLFAAEPYETIAFKISNESLDSEQLKSNWDDGKQVFTLKVAFNVTDGDTRVATAANDATSAAAAVASAKE